MYQPHRLDTLLLVEDNPGDIRLFRELLKEASSPFEIREARDLAQALDLLQRERFALVLLDLSLPDSRGIETFRALQRQAPDIPIVVLSGLSDEALALQTVEEGAQDYLVKGEFDPQDLIRAMIYAIKRSASDRALADERNLLRSVIDNLVDAIYVRGLDGRYLLDNEAHRQLVGLPSTQAIVGQATADFFPDETAARLDAEDREIMRSGQPILNREEYLVPLHPDGKRWVAITKVPLRNRQGEITGVIGIAREITERKQAEEKIGRYHAELRQRNQEMEDDLRMAREIQQAFLPHQFPTFPSWAPPEESALRFHSRYIPTTAVGGDFFHILPISDTQAGIFICDVMGHGVRAALVTAIHRTMIEEMLPLATDPGALLTEVNRLLLSILRRTRTPMFASAFYLVIDLEEGVLQYANAGHPSPVHFHHDADEIHFLAPERPGPALGIFEGSHYETHQCTAGLHDIIVLFTDGLFEVEGDDHTFFNQDRLLRVFERHRSPSVKTVIEETIDEIREFALDHTFDDDVCLVGVGIERTRARELVEVL